MKTLAIDCDLRKVYAALEGGRVVCKADPEARPIFEDHWPDWTILFEIASALDYSDSKAIAHNKRRWTIWNVAMAVRLDRHVRDTGGTFLVSPSHKWTRGHGREVRHALAKCQCTQKDLRECEAMIFMHHHRPQDWVPLQEFLDAI